MHHFDPDNINDEYEDFDDDDDDDDDNDNERQKQPQEMVNNIKSPPPPVNENIYSYGNKARERFHSSEMIMRFQKSQKRLSDASAHKRSPITSSTSTSTTTTTTSSWMNNGIVGVDPNSAPIINNNSSNIRGSVFTRRSLASFGRSTSRNIGSATSSSSATTPTIPPGGK